MSNQVDVDRDAVEQAAMSMRERGFDVTVSDNGTGPAISVANHGPQKLDEWLSLNAQNCWASIGCRLDLTIDATGVIHVPVDRQVRVQNGNEVRYASPGLHGSLSQATFALSSWSLDPPWDVEINFDEITVRFDGVPEAANALTPDLIGFLIFLQVALAASAGMVASIEANGLARAPERARPPDRSTMSETSLPKIRGRELGPLRVALLNFGENKIAVIKAIRSSCDLGLKEAKDLVEAAQDDHPVVVARGLDEESAAKVVHELEEVGALARTESEEQG